MHIIYIPNLITLAIIATECSEKENKQTKQAINWTTRIGYAIKPAKQSMMRLKDRRGVDCDSGANKDHDKCLCHIYVYIYIHICGMCYVIWQIWDLRWRCGWRRLWFFTLSFSVERGGHIGPLSRDLSLAKNAKKPFQCGHALLL